MNEKSLFDDYGAIVNLMTDDWHRRGLSMIVPDNEPGCFVWTSFKDGMLGSGLFYTYDMVTKYFHHEMADFLQEEINEVNHDTMIVLAIIFEGQAVSYYLNKPDPNTAMEDTPSTNH